MIYLDKAEESTGQLGGSGDVCAGYELMAAVCLHTLPGQICLQ